MYKIMKSIMIVALLPGCGGTDPATTAARDGNDRGPPPSTERRGFPEPGTKAHFTYHAVREAVFSWDYSSRPSGSLWPTADSAEVRLGTEGMAQVSAASTKTSQSLETTCTDGGPVVCDNSSYYGVTLQAIDGSPDWLVVESLGFSMVKANELGHRIDDDVTGASVVVHDGLGANPISDVRMTLSGGRELNFRCRQVIFSNRPTSLGLTVECDAL